MYWFSQLVLEARYLGPEGVTWRREPNSIWPVQIRHIRDEVHRSRNVNGSRLSSESQRPTPRFKRRDQAQIQGQQRTNLRPQKDEAGNGEREVDHLKMGVVVGGGGGGPERRKEEGEKDGGGRGRGVGTGSAGERDGECGLNKRGKEEREAGP